MKNRNYIVEKLSDYDALFSNLILLYKKTSIVFLKGELGSGKTTFIQRYMQYHHNIENVTSPTFGIVNNYLNSDNNIFHYDLYRINDHNELNEFGFYENLDINTLHLIEWPEIIPSNLVIPNIIISFKLINSRRLLSINFLDE
jgi:tRNA threonylcarbamoyladenosine biosynthesis protein TsaE